MKRRTPLARKQPLRAKTGLSSHTPLERGGPLRAVSVKRARLAPVRRHAEQLLAENNPHCARCGAAREVHGHERIKRSQGGDWTNPDCLLCNLCNEWASSHMRDACWTGWAISPKWPHNPDLAPDEAVALNGTVVVFSPTPETEQEELV